MYKVASLFSGVGGLDWGFHVSPNFELVFANDLESTACNTYKTNFNNSEQYLKEGDIETYVNTIPAHDILLGGFPCQPFSMAGNREGFEDKQGRGVQYKNCIKVLETNKPSYFVFENVKGIRHHNKGKTLKIIIEDFKNTGYKVHTELVKMMEYGVSQARERVIFFGVRDDVCLDPSRMVPPTTGNALPLKQLLKQIEWEPVAGEPDKYYVNHNYHVGNGEAKVHWMSILKEGENLSKLDESEIRRRETMAGLGARRIPKTLMGYRRLHGDQIAPTMMFGNTCLPIHPFENRSLSVREAALVQGFPLEFKFEGGIAAQYKQVGNAVPPLFSIELVKHLLTVI